MASEKEKKVIRKVQNLILTGRVIVKELTDTERVKRAKLFDGRYYSPWEQMRCPHGKFYYGRWTWGENSSIENSDTDVGGNNCEECKNG